MTGKTIKHFCRASMGVVLLWFLASSATVNAQSALTKESKLKAAYLFNFTKYVEWPDAVFSANNGELIICIDRHPQMEGFLQALAKDRRVGKQQRTLKITSVENAVNCHLAYLQQDHNGDLEKLNQSLNVSEQNNSADQIGMRFFQQNGKLRFEISMREIDRLNIAISSELLKLARIN